MDRSHNARWFVGLNIAEQRGGCRAIHRTQRAQTLPRYIVVKPPVEEFKLVRHHGLGNVQQLKPTRQSTARTAASR